MDFDDVHLLPGQHVLEGLLDGAVGEVHAEQGVARLEGERPEDGVDGRRSIPSEHHLVRFRPFVACRVACRACGACRVVSCVIE